jgi:hypothetical protein
LNCCRSIGKIAKRHRNCEQADIVQNLSFIRYICHAGTWGILLYKRGNCGLMWNKVQLNPYDFFESADLKPRVMICGPLGISGNGYAFHCAKKKTKKLYYFFESAGLKHYVMICRPLGYTGKPVYLPLRKEEDSSASSTCAYLCTPDFFLFRNRRPVSP